MKNFLVRPSPELPPDLLMARDATFLANLTPTEQFLHLYEWQGDCATYGHFVDPKDYFREDGVADADLRLGRRPTGGGILFHTCDYAFSVFIGRDSDCYRTNTLDSYAFVNQWVGTIIEKVFSVHSEITVYGCESTEPILERFCMAKPTKFDLIVGGRKVGGAAQRRTKRGLLHQGSICLTLPSKAYLEQVLLEGPILSQAMHTNSFPLLGENATQTELREARKAIKDAMMSRL